MSLYLGQKLLFNIYNDPELRAFYKPEPNQTLKECGFAMERPRHSPLLR